MWDDHNISGFSGERDGVLFVGDHSSFSIVN